MNTIKFFDTNTIRLATIALCATLALSMAVPASAKEQTYQQWLERYQAWDVLERTLARDQSVEASSSTIVLEQARAFIRMNSPAQALKLLQAQPPLDDPALERERLWLGGRASRLAGDPVRSVLWFSQAARHMQPEQFVNKLKNEPRLSVVWKDSWRVLYWRYLAASPLARQSQRAILELTMNQARLVWPESGFWKNVNALWNMSPMLPQATEEGEPAPEPAYPAFVITPSDRSRITRAMAATGLGRKTEAQKLVKEISEPMLARFWAGFLACMNSGEPFDGVVYFKASGLDKAAAFLDTELSAENALNATAWTMAMPDSPSWQRFLAKLEGMPLNQALELAENEVRSTLIAPETISVLQTMRLGLALMAEDDMKSRQALEALDKRALPLGFKLAVVLELGQNIQDLLSADPMAAAREQSRISLLAQAAGKPASGMGQAPFWGRFQEATLAQASSLYPLDRLTILACWQHNWENKQDPMLAKRIAMLYPRTALGTDALISLSSAALEVENYGLANYYQRKIDPALVTGELRPSFLLAKATLAYKLGRGDEALKTFHMLVDQENAPLPYMTQLQAALLAQQKGELKWADKLLAGLYERQDKPEKVQKAEILFWMAEGHQSMGENDRALDEYLNLAWKYPEANIWAVTAMYRASMIYEKRGKYEAAKKLLTTVIKRADREAQREAAEARLRAVDKKLGKKPKKAEKVVYPY